MDMEINRQVDPFTREIIQALYEVDDPELGINIVDLGLVYEIAINKEKKQILIEMTLSTPSCPLGGLITNHVKLAVESLHSGYEPTVDIVWEPKWNAERITERGRELLGW